MKFSWGTGIVLTFVLFFAGIAVLVVIAFSNRVDLVRDDYYEETLQHERQLDRQRRSAAMPEKVAIGADASGVRVRFPAALDRGAIAGTIELYRPADGRRDFKVPVSPDSAGVQLVPASSLEPGLWRVKLRWTYAGAEFYDEDAVMVQ